MWKKKSSWCFNLLSKKTLNYFYHLVQVYLKSWTCPENMIHIIYLSTASPTKIGDTWVYAVEKTRSSIPPSQYFIRSFMFSITDREESHQIRILDHSSSEKHQPMSALQYSLKGSLSSSDVVKSN